MIDDFKPVPKKTKKTEPDHEPLMQAAEPEPSDAQGTEFDNAEVQTTVPVLNTKPPKKRRRLLAKFKALSGKKKLLIGFGILLAIALLTTTGFVVFHKKPVAKAVVVVKKAEPAPAPPKPTTETSNLTGLQVPIDTNKIPVTGVMIENSPDARPQSGLKDAGVVFEAVAEGGITRFLALFQDSAVPDYIGPIRSVRPYYLDYLGGFDAAVAHVGGSPEALGQVRNQSIKDLDQFYNGGAYHRITARYAPHNVYSSIAQLVDLQKTKGFTSNYIGFARKGKEAPSATPTARTIDLVISGYLYNVHYDYNPTTNSYNRSEGGKPHVDERSNAQLSPKVVAVMVVPQGINPDGIHTTYQSIGSGKLYLFQDGTVTEGIWEKTDRKTQVHFGDANGAPLSINPGQTWVTLVGTAGSVTYKP